MGESNTSVFLGFVRWVLFLPIAIAAAMALRVTVFHINRYALSSTIPFIASKYLGPDSLLGGSLVVLFSDGAMGAALVYVAVFIAPSHKRQVAIVIGASTLLLGLARSIYLLQDGDLWGAFSYFCVAMSALLCAVSRLRKYRAAHFRE